MRNLFYKIWVDVIVNFHKNPQVKSSWKFDSMFIMSMLVALNIMMIFMWIGFLGIHTNLFKIPSLEIDFFPGTMLDSFTMFFLQYALPSLLLNYFLIFHKEKYKHLIKKYSDYKGKLFMVYMFATIGIFFIPVLFYYWLY